MASEQTSLTLREDAGEARVGTVLSTLLALTSDAALIFDRTGIVTLANDEALQLLAPSLQERQTLVGFDVRMLFPPAVGVTPSTPFACEELPVPCDGSSASIMRLRPDGRPMGLVVRCERVDETTGTYVLVAHPEQGGEAAEREHERLVEELSRANRRLSGTLDIVLGTLDSPSVGTLFERVLEELCETMDATGATVYLAERGGFHLRGTSESLAGAQVPRFLPAKRSLSRLALQAEHALRLRVLPPDGQALRRGRLARRSVMDEQTRVVHEIQASQLPPFSSFMMVPVRFGGNVIALIEVGWRSARMIPRDDAELLDAVTRYLSVQLVGAMSALRSQRREQLATLANELRDTLVASPVTRETCELVEEAVSRDLDCVCAPLIIGQGIEGHEVVLLPVSHEEVAVPSDLLSLEEGVTALMPDAPLSTWLREREEPCLGALVDSGAAEEGRVRFLALRPADAEPFDDLELNYLSQVADTARAVANGDQGRRRDHRISQALQSGMRSELQKVRGISSQGIYSSATKSAFVGGDFYDLIALPERRACVIMGDVSGKGVEAASVSAAVRTALGAYSWEGLDPAQMVRLLNDFLLGFSRIETFATLFVGIIDLSAATLAYCSAGHPPAIMLRACSGELEWLDVQSGVVGAFRDMTYRNGEIALSAGDVLLLYTDGTTEARATDGRFFGEEGLRDTVMREGVGGFEGLLDRLLATVDDFTGNNLDDDVAMVALRFDELGA